MNNEQLQNKLLYIEEHRSCRNYLEKVEHGFKYIELEPDEILADEESRWNQLLFVLKGECVIQCNRLGKRPFREGVMVLLPKKAAIEIRALADVHLLVLSFDVPLNTCDRLSLQALWDVCEQMQYDFSPIEIRYPLPPYIELVTSCLNNEMDCGHFHLLLEEELFFLLRNSYRKEELALLFHPIIAPQLSFKDFIVENYLKADSVNHLVTLSNMGRTPFFIKFKQTFGMSAKQWMMQQRNMHIIDRILTSGFTIKELMEEFNFANLSHFNHYCRKHFQCTPRELITKFRA